MTKLKTLMVPRFYGKNPTLESEDPMLNEDGLLVSTKTRFKNPNKMLLEVIDQLRQGGMVFETVGTGLKIGKVVEERRDSVCVLHNVGETTFGLYILKAPMESLPKRSFKTEGEPIRGANSHSSRIAVPYEGNDATSVATFIQALPTTFESGRKTTFNHGRQKKAKKTETSAKENNTNAEKKEKKEKKGEVLNFTDKKDETTAPLDEALQSGRRKKTKKAVAASA